MASDNEDDDLEALRKAALATLKQKVQPIEKVFSGGISSRPENSPPWSEVPASIDFPGFADPVPEAASFPGPHAETVTRPPHPTWPPAHHNGMARPGQRFRHGLGADRNKFDPRFPHRTFCDRGGPMYDRGRRRMRREYLPQLGRGTVLSGIPFANQSHPQHPSIPSSQGPAITNVGTNLIVIQPQICSGERGAPPRSTHSISHDSTTSRSSAGGNPPPVNKILSQTKSNLALPQDKYHTSLGGTQTSTDLEGDEAKPETKAKDKFSRYDQSDSDEDDASDVDDIANEIDKVLQDDILTNEVTAESEEVKDKEEEESPPDLNVSDTKSDGEDIDALAEESDSDQSDKESLDLDALAGGDPVLGDFEDLDSLVDRDPDNEPVVDGDKDNNSVNSNQSDKVKNVSLNSPRSVSHGDEVSPGKKETNSEGDNCLEITVSDKILHTDLEAALLNGPSSAQKQSKSKSPPPNPRSPQRKRSVSPSRYDSYRRPYPLSPRRSRSPLYTNRRRSSSPKRSPLRYSNRNTDVSRRSISPRRRASPTLGQRRFASPRAYPRGREHSPRRRSLSPIRRNRSPQRDRIRDSRQDSRYARDYNSSRRGEDQFGHRPPRDRPPPQQHDRHERQSGSNNPTPQEKSNPRESNVKTENPHDGISTSKKKISPLLERNTSSEREKVTVDLEKLTPEEKARIEARRRKFDSKGELKVAETGKTISLKSIKTREKKQKKKNEKESASKEDEALPKVSKKKTEGISLKKLRKKQESKKSTEQELDNDSPKAVGLLDLEDDSEESDGGRSWKKESAGVSGLKIKFAPSRSPQKATLLSLDRIGTGKNRFDSKRHNDRHKQTSHKERVKPHRLQNKWSSDEEDNGAVEVNRLSSSVMRSKPFEADLPPDKLRVQVQVTTKESKKKSKVVPDFSKVYSVPAKRHHEASENSQVLKDEEEVPTKKIKKKKEKKKKHSKEAGKSSHMVLEDEVNTLQSPKSPAKLSILERLGKKIDLKSIEKREKKRSKKNHSSDEGTNDLDDHIRKMKAKNEEILRRQKEIQLDKEKYG